MDAQILKSSPGECVESITKDGSAMVMSSKQGLRIGETEKSTHSIKYGTGLSEAKQQRMIYPKSGSIFGVLFLMLKSGQAITTGFVKKIIRENLVEIIGIGELFPQAKLMRNTKERQEIIKKVTEKIIQKVRSTQILKKTTESQSSNIIKCTKIKTESVQFARVMKNLLTIILGKYDALLSIIAMQLEKSVVCFARVATGGLALSMTDKMFYKTQLNTYQEA